MEGSSRSTASSWLKRLAAAIQLAGRALERHPILRWGLFLAGFVVITVPGYFMQDAFALANYANAPASSWSPMEFWISAAECTRKTGAWLAACLPDGKLISLADTSGNDDPGHSLLLSLASVILDRPIAVIDIVRLNVVIDYFGLFAMAALLFVARCYVATIVTLLTGVEVYLYWVGVAPHPALIGAAACAAVLPLTIVLSERGLLGKTARPTALIGGAALLGFATLIRQPIGMMGLVISFGALAWLIWRNPPSRRPLRLLTLLALAVVAWQTPRWVTLARDAVFDVPPTANVQEHGISHSLYMGLGAVENKFGIVWGDDTWGLKAARLIDPQVDYPSRRYFRLMWKIYLDRVMEDPVEVARIYWTKTRQLLTHPFPWGWWPQWAVLPLVIGLLVVDARLGLFAAAEFPQGPIIICVALAFDGFFVLQGILAQQGWGYAHPLGAFVALFLAIVIELACRLLVPVLSRKFVRQSGQ